MLSNRKPHVQFRFTQYTGNGKYALMEIHGGVENGTWFPVRDDLTPKAAAVIVRRLAHDLREWGYDQNGNRLGSQKKGIQGS